MSGGEAEIGLGPRSSSDEERAPGGNRRDEGTKEARRVLTGAPRLCSRPFHSGGRSSEVKRK